ncbi:unnamed protein product, partial [Brenthis ino]
MSEGDVSLIRDEDVLRRMWQQTEDFSRKKEIRAHMYRLREERLRNLYSPEPGAEAKGCEFSSTQGHVKSFADQSFQSMKSKEVRDAGSPPKEFTYRGQDLKELSNAGWNVESENRTTDDGHTHVKSVHANIEGRYDVDGGHGQFAAVDHTKQAVTEYDDGNTSLKRNENVSDTAAHEEVVRKTDDGTHFSSTKSSSTSSSKFEQISSKRETVPYKITGDYDLSSQKSFDTNRNEKITSNEYTKTTNYEQNLRTDFDQGDLISRKIDYPDENTKVIVETRCLPDGTRVTSTRREFRAPAVQTSHSEEHSHQVRSENKSSSYSSSQKRTHVDESTSNIVHEHFEDNTNNIVDSQKIIDDYDFKRNKDIDSLINKKDNYKYDANIDNSTERKQESNDKIRSTHHEVYTSQNEDYSQRRNMSEMQSVQDVNERMHSTVKKTHSVKNVEDYTDHTMNKTESVQDIKNRTYNTVNKNHSDNNVEQKTHNIIRENVVIEKKSDQYQSTYQTDFSQKKISNDWSPAHQAWASTLRSDTPSRPSTRASSPGSKTFKSSTSSLRSSVSPDKTYRKPSSRGNSPNKIDRLSPTHIISEKYSSTNSSSSVVERTKKSTSPDRKTQDCHPSRSSTSPEKYYPNRSSSPSQNSQRNDTPRADSNTSKSTFKPKEKSTSPQRPYLNAEREPTNQTIPPTQNVTGPRDSSPQKFLKSDFKNSEVPVMDERPVKYYTPDFSPTKTNPVNEMPRKQSLSPDRKTRHQKPSSPTKSATEPIQRQYKEPSPVRKLPQEAKATDDCLPGYMKPTASSKPKFTDNPSPTQKYSESTINAFEKPSKSPERRGYDRTVHKIKEDHYKFIDEETKMYSVSNNRQTIETETNEPTSAPGKLKVSDSLDSLDNDQYLKSRSPSPEKCSNESPSCWPKRPNEDISNINDTLQEPEQISKSRSSPTRILAQNITKPDNSSRPKDLLRHSKSPSPTRQRPTTSELRHEFTTYKSKSPSPEKSPSPKRHIFNKEKLYEEKELSPNKKSSIPSKPIIQDTGKPDKTLKNGDTLPETTYSPTEDRAPLRNRKPSPVKNNQKATKVDKISGKQITTMDTVIHATSKHIETTDNFSDHTLKQNHVTLINDEATERQTSPKRAASPTKFGTFDKKLQHHGRFEDKQDIPEKKIQPDKPKTDQTPSHTLLNKSPRNSVSPSKVLSKEIKYKQASDFINQEKNFEEINKHTLKERPRQLVTPSTSPTRKPKSTEIPTSSGQSSPTTSCGFEYFPASQTKTIITDLDNKDFYAQNTKYNQNEEEKSVNNQSSSKIPCRSPSPEKHPTKETLPRKSSLKKTVSNQMSPTEKPPSNFLVSPNVETKEFTDHKVVIQDHPIKQSDKPVKPKPPFERRETYEERCRKILGMIETDTRESEETTNKQASELSSPSVSPCRSPSPKKNSLFNKNVTEETEITNVDKFSSYECEDDSGKNVNLNNICDNRKISKIPTRETSPTKLQDITGEKQESITSIKTTTFDTKESIKKEVSEKLHEKSKYLRSSPEKKIEEQNIYGKFDVPDNIRHPIKQSKPTEVIKHPESPVSKQLVNDDKGVDTKTKPKTTISINKHTKPKGDKPSEYEINHSTTSVIEDSDDNINDEISFPKSKSPITPTHKLPVKASATKQVDDYHSNRTSILTSEFIASENEKEVLDRVQKSLRKLSPERIEKPSIRDKSPSKSTTALRDLEITSKSDKTLENKTKKHTEKSTTNIITEDVDYVENQKNDKPKDQKISSKPPSRNVSPIKKVSNISPLPARSTSPKKPVSPIERPQSPSIPKVCGIKPRDTITSHIRKPSPGTIPQAKLEKPTVVDVKKGTTNINKQPSHSTQKSTTTKLSLNKTQSAFNKSSEQDLKKIPVPKVKDNLRKDNTKVMRTVSDITLKSKQTSPQRIKSKPEIQVNDISTGKTTRQTLTSSKIQKSLPKESQIKLPTSKPKSATALNTSTDDDDVIIDVQQAKSSRENSPDRICPTPVGFTEDVGTPRFPDEVNEPDDDYQKRTYQTIHEAESIVDDIVEISEDDELFTKKTDLEEYIEADERLLSVNDKVSKFAHKNENVTNDTTERFKETERKAHSDFMDENLKSDDCLLSVSEKVNKFAKGPIHTKDNKSPSRNIVEEFDKHTTYQDDYTKLSVNDKAHLFIETAENVKTTKPKPTQKIERPDFNDVDDTLKSDDCLLSVSDKVNKFVKTAEQFLNETYEDDEKEKKIKEQHEKIMRKIVENMDDTVTKSHNEDSVNDTKLSSKKYDNENRRSSLTKETVSSNAKVKDYISPNIKPTEKPSVKITTLRSSDAVKKAKALFETIASTTTSTHKTAETPSKSSKLTDNIGMKKPPKLNPTNVHPAEKGNNTAKEKEIINLSTLTTTKKETLNEAVTEIHDQRHIREEKPHRASPARLRPLSPEVIKAKSPCHQLNDVASTVHSNDISKQKLLGSEKSQDKIPGYQRPTKTSQIKEETKIVEETEVSSRRGSGKFGVELRRTSTDRSTPTNERRRSSVEHHQPCIEDIFDLDLLEQMLEKVVGYEQRRRIRAQIRVAKKKIEKEQVDTSNTLKVKQSVSKTTKLRSPDRHHKSPERAKVAPQKTVSPDRHLKTTPHKAFSPTRNIKSSPHTTLPSEPKGLENKHVLNGHGKETYLNDNEKFPRPHSPEKMSTKMPTKSRSPTRHASPEKKRPMSPTKTSATKPKSNRFNEYASAYMKKVGLKDSDKKIEIKKSHVDEQKTKKSEVLHTVETKVSTISSKKTSERTASQDTFEVTHINGGRSPSPVKLTENRPQQQEKLRTLQRQISPKRTIHGPERAPRSPDRKRSPQRSLSPELIRQKSDTSKIQAKKETIIKTVFDIEKKLPQKPKQEEKPTWVMNRNLKKTSETRTFTTKKVEPEKPKYRAVSPSKVISKPIDVITSSYGPGPLDADGRPLFGIKALRNGANYQVKGTVIRQEFHSRNGGEPEGTVSVTAYSTEPEDLEKLLQTQGERPSRIHGLAAITTTKKFGGDTGTTLSEVHNKEERAVLDQFTHNERRVIESKITSSNLDTNDDFVQKEISQVENERYVQEDRHHNKADEFEKHSSKEIKSEKASVKQSNRIQIEKEKRVELERREKEKMERNEKREDRKAVRQSSVKSLTEKYIKSASETSKSERHVYPKAGLILRTSTMKDSVSSLTRTDSEHSLGSDEEVVTTTTTEETDDGVKTTTTTTTRSGHTRGQERSFLDSSTKVTGVQDILTRMKNADIVIEEGDSSADTEARALLNKFLGATVLMAGMQGYVTEKPSGKVVIKEETVQTSGGKVTSSRRVEEFDIEQCWDERVLRKLLDECSDYEQRRRLRARIRTLMAEQEACASAVTEALAAAGETVDTEEQSGERGESLLLPLLQGLLQGGGQRLLAGLGAASHDVVADVRRSLQRLRLALAPPNDHPQARALLALADRLEDALDAADRLDGCKKKPRRRSRTSRHTVGVTREELEEARRLVDRDQLLPDSVKQVTPSTSSFTSSVPSTEDPSTPERKQSVDEQVCFHNAIESKEKVAPIAHNASYDKIPKINNDVCVVERRTTAPRKPDFFRHSIADTTHSEHPKSAAERWHSETKNSIAAIANKFDAKVQKEAPTPVRRAPINRPTVTIQNKEEDDLRRSSFYRPPPPGYNFAAPPPADDLSKPLSRFNNNKRNRMKRANTIDIGRPLGGYKIDSDTEDENMSNSTPKVPEFQPQTENDRKFLAFMQKNQENYRNGVVGQANWNNRFGNIKNTFERREREENNRSSSTSSSAKRFWQNTNESSYNPAPRPRKFLADITPEIVKPPWVSQRRDSLRSQVPQAPPQKLPQTQQSAELQPPNKQIVKPFVAKPIPVNQFSHAPMSAFKPPKKILSPTSVSPNVWSPPSSNIPVSPSIENSIAFSSVLNPLSPASTAPFKVLASEVNKTRKLQTVSKFENDKIETQAILIPKTYGYHQPTPPTHVPQNYPIKPIPSQNNLAAPELVKKLDESKILLSPQSLPPKIDAQQLQIEFYERQIREKHRREASNERRDIPTHKPPAPPAPVYTIVDYTPSSITSSFVPLQQTPDIEKAKAHKVDYLPDVVMNETSNYDYLTSPTSRISSVSPSKSKVPQEYQNGVTHKNDFEDGTTTEHDSVVTRVMRGPVRGAATITTGVRTRGAADNLRGMLDKFSSPKHEVISQIEKKKREIARNQVRLPAPPSARPGLSPLHAPSPPRPAHAPEHEGLPRSPAGLRSPALATSRESVISSESLGSRGSSPGSALARSGSWHRLSEFSPKASSPRKVVSRTKSMHILAIPKLYEGGIAHEELPEKKRTVEAYFTGQASPGRVTGGAVVGRVTRAAGVRVAPPPQYALGRSRTMPTVSELQFLDESNADDAFEDLVSALACVSFTEEEVTTVTSNVRRNSSEKTVSSSTTTIKSSKVIESMTRPAPKPVSPFAKFRQLEKQNSTNSPNISGFE